MNVYSLFNPAAANLLPGRLASLADTLLRDSACPAGNCESARKWEPSVNVVETNDGYEVSTELPGVTAADVKVVVREGVLTIEGERKAEPLAEGAKSLLTERRSGPFQRAFRLPRDADGERISAAFKDGVLEVAVPRREEVKPREIEVQIK